MSKNIRTQLGKVIGKTLNSYHTRVKPIIDDLKFKEQYQGRIIDCMVGEVDDNYIETPETDSAIVKLEHSKEGLVKIPSIKGKTILVDSEGNETDTPGEGCRLVSVGEDESNKMIILSKNKNLFDGETRKGYYSNGVFKANADNLANVNPIRIKPNTSYVGSGDAIPRMSFYDKDMNFISYSTNACTISPSNAYYMNIHAHSATWFQIEEGTIATARVNGKHHKTEILLDEPLRSLPNGVCDEIIGNKLIRRVGYYVLNEKVFNIGSEDAGWTPQIQTIPFYKYCNQFSPQLDVKKVSVCFSNILKSTGSFVNADKEGIGFSNGNPNASYIGGRLNRDRISKQDGYEVAKLLNGTQIQYELAEPIVEELPNGITLQGFDDTTMYIENTITPTVSYGYNALIPYKEELSKQKEEVETNTLDIENNIIPYLMDMEFNLMLMEDN